MSLFLILSSICFVIRNHLFSTVPTLLVKQHFSKKPAEKGDGDVFAAVYWQCVLGKAERMNIDSTCLPLRKIAKS